MSKRILFAFVLFLISVHSAFATFCNIRPVVGIAYGFDFTNLSRTENITIFSPFFNTYTSNKHDTSQLGSLFLGIEAYFNPNFAGQVGLGLYQNQDLQPKGRVIQFGDPNLNGLSYQYKIRSQRVLIETKLLWQKNQEWKPFLSFGFGRAFNRSYQYQEYPVTSADLPMAEPFRSQQSNSFSYFVGIGLDYVLNDNARVGISYRYANLGSSSLGKTPLQDSNQKLNYPHLRSNEFLGQLTLLA